MAFIYLFVCFTRLIYLFIFTWEFCVTSQWSCDTTFFPWWGFLVESKKHLFNFQSISFSWPLIRQGLDSTTHVKTGPPRHQRNVCNVQNVFKSGKMVKHVNSDNDYEYFMTTAFYDPWGMLANRLALPPHRSVIGEWNRGFLLCDVCMVSPCSRGVFSSHIPKTIKVLFAED